MVDDERPRIPLNYIRSTNRNELSVSNPKVIILKRYNYSGGIK